MANEVSTFMTNGSANIREDVGDFIYSISKKNCTFMNMIGNEKASSNKVEWLEDVDRAATTNRKPEEWSGTPSAKTLPTRLYNYTQKFADMFMVDDTMQKAAKIGRKDEIARITEKTMREVSKDIEYALLNNSTAPSAASAGVGGFMKGAKGFVTTNTYNFGGTTSAGNILTEVIFQDALQKVYEADGDPGDVVTSPWVSRKIAGFTGNPKAVINSESKDKTIGTEVAYYQSQFGLVKVNIAKILEPKDVSTVKYDYMFVIDRSKWAIAWLDKLYFERQAKQGFNTPVLVAAECSLKSYNEATNFQMSNIARF